MLRVLTIVLLFSGLCGKLYAQHDQWQSYSTEDFNYYYSSDLQKMAKAINFKFKNELFELQNVLNYHLNSKVDVFLVSNWIEKEHLQQDMLIEEDSDAGLISSLAQRIVLDISYDPQELMISFREQVSLIIFNEMMFGGSLQDQMRSANLIYFPSWFVHGIAHYLGHGWDGELDNAWRAVYEICGVERFNDSPKNAPYRCRTEKPLFFYQ